MDKIEVKALINKKKNKVVCVECNGDFVDVLFSFLTMPMGTILKLTENRASSATIGSMNNLYKSVESLDLKYFRTKQCKEMLLSPKSSSDRRIKNIAKALGNDQAYDIFLCQKYDCSHNLISYYKDAYCHCENIMNNKIQRGGLALEDENGGRFVKGLSRYVISDELQITPLSTAAAFSLLSKQGVKNFSCSEMEEKIFGIGKDEILSLLKSLLVSKAPLTEIMLKNSEVNQECFNDRTSKKRKIESSSGDPTGNISLKLIVSQTNGTVYYAEANEDFIDLLFSFLTIPLGNLAKAMLDSSSKGCANNIYRSVLSLDAAVHLISEEVKLSLLFPTIRRHFGIKKQLLGFEEGRENHLNMQLGRSTSQSQFTYMDPKSKYNKKESKSSSRGYVKGQTMFTVTENLVIKPISVLSGFSILMKLNIPVRDVKERVVHVGKEEATRLLVASLISETPLTDVFTRLVPKTEY